MNNIDDLLKKYFEGETSPEEEKTLKSYFRSDTVSPRHEMYKPLFAAFDKEKQIAAPRFAIPKEKSKPQPRTLIGWTIGVAAAILLIVMLFPLQSETEKTSEYVVFINGKKITNRQQAKAYAEEMFMQTDKIIRTSYEPFVEANAMQTEMDADKLFRNLYQNINNSVNQ